MSDKMEHSKTPWRFERPDRGKILDADGQPVCDYYTAAGAPPSKADEEFLLRAVNSHDALVAALRAYQNANGLHHDDEARLYDLGEAALAKAEEGK